MIWDLSIKIRHLFISVVFLYVYLIRFLFNSLANDLVLICIKKNNDKL